MWLDIRSIRNNCIIASSCKRNGIYNKCTSDSELTCTCDLAYLTSARVKSRVWGPQLWVTTSCHHLSFALCFQNSKIQINNLNHWSCSSSGTMLQIIICNFSFLSTRRRGQKIDALNLSIYSYLDPFILSTIDHMSKELKESYLDEMILKDNLNGSDMSFRF